MKVAIHQPSYWPWLGLLAKIAKADVFVFLETVEAATRSNQYRNQFYRDGHPVHLTLPVNHGERVMIHDLRFKQMGWERDHLNKLGQYYRKAPFFAEIFPDVERVYSRLPGLTPVDVLLETMRFAIDAFGIPARLVRSRDLGPHRAKGLLNLDICLQLGASEYISGMGAWEYMQDVLGAFAEQGVSVTWSRFEHPAYEQAPGRGFVEGLACLDLLFFHGYEGARAVFWPAVTGAA